MSEVVALHGVQVCNRSLIISVQQVVLRRDMRHLYQTNVLVLDLVLDLVLELVVNVLMVDSQIGRSPFERRPGSAKTSAHFGLQSTPVVVRSEAVFASQKRFSHYRYKYGPTQCPPQRQCMLVSLNNPFLFF